MGDTFLPEFPQGSLPVKAAIAKDDILIYSYSMKYSISQRLWALKLQLKGCLVSEDQLESGHQLAMNISIPRV